jgi:DNA-binding ferritin-like protein
MTLTSFIKPAIDLDQYAKTTFLNTYVKEDSIREPLQELVNNQSQLTRNFFNAIEDVTTSFSQFDVSKLFNFGK